MSHHHHHHQNQYYTQDPNLYNQNNNLNSNLHLNNQGFTGTNLNQQPYVSGQYHQGYTGTTNYPTQEEIGFSGQTQYYNHNLNQQTNYQNNYPNQNQVFNQETINQKTNVVQTPYGVQENINQKTTLTTQNQTGIQGTTYQNTGQIGQNTYGNLQPQVQSTVTQNTNLNQVIITSNQNQGINKGINQGINQVTNQGINQVTNQGINQVTQQNVVHSTYPTQVGSNLNQNINLGTHQTTNLGVNTQITTNTKDTIQVNQQTGSITSNIKETTKITSNQATSNVAYPTLNTNLGYQAPPNLYSNQVGVSQTSNIQNQGYSVNPTNQHTNYQGYPTGSSVYNQNTGYFNNAYPQNTQNTGYNTSSNVYSQSTGYTNVPNTQTFGYSNNVYSQQPNLIHTNLNTGLSNNVYVQKAPRVVSYMHLINLSCKKCHGKGFWQKHNKTKYCKSCLKSSGICYKCAGSGYRHDGRPCHKCDIYSSLI